MYTLYMYVLNIFILIESSLSQKSNYDHSYNRLHPLQRARAWKNGPTKALHFILKEYYISHVKLFQLGFVLILLLVFCFLHELSIDLWTVCTMK